MMERSRESLGVSNDPIFVSRGEASADPGAGEAGPREAEGGGGLSRHRPPGPGDPPPRWRGIVPSPRAALALVALFVVVVLGFSVFRARGAEPATISVRASGSTVPWEALASTSGAATGDPTGDSEQVVVHVVGAVKSPGLVRLPKGSLVDDAIQAAGGANDDARLDGINLAEVLVTGRQIRVPSTDEAPPPGATASNASLGGNAASSDSLNGAAPGKVNINSASAEELQRLPKVGPKLAQRIIDWRTHHGPFHNAEELDAVPGIGPGLLASLEPLVTW